MERSPGLTNECSPSFQPPRRWRKQGIKTGSNTPVTALFIHCGNITAGCIGIANNECPAFMKAMAEAKPRSITLMPRRQL